MNKTQLKNKLRNMTISEIAEMIIGLETENTKLKDGISAIKSNLSKLETKLKKID